MKALTICQPFAHLIVTPQSELPPGSITKRVENRVWPTRYRGPLLIHAGKSRDWLDEDPSRPGYELGGLHVASMPFGALVGLAELIDCVHVDNALTGAGLPVSLHWMRDHPHTDGPWCWVLDKVVRFNSPITWTGARSLWDVPDDAVAAAIRDGSLVEVAA